MVVAELLRCSMQGLTVALPGFVVLTLTFGWSGSAGVAATKADRQREATSLVREALHREIYGLEKERQQLLEQAAELAPTDAAVHWHQGEVRYCSRWYPVDGFALLAGDRKRLDSYERLRARAPQTVPGQMMLADWCAREQMRMQEVAHLSRVIEMAPNHADARRRLGYQQINGQWVQRVSIWGDPQDKRTVQESFDRWKDQLLELRDRLGQRNLQQRQAAREQLLGIADPSAIAALELVLGSAGEGTAQLLTEVLAGMPHHEASLGLARQAVGSPWLSVRELAAQRLQNRPFDGFVPALLSELSSPIESTVQTALINGTIVYRHLFLREGRDERKVSVLDHTFSREASLPTAPDDPDSTSGDELDAADARELALMRIREDIRQREQAVGQRNAQILMRNERICQALCLATGQDNLTTPQEWWNWWNEENEVVLQGEKQSNFQYARQDTVYQTVGVSAPGAGGQVARHECFVAGTPVWTVAGSKPIETIQVGDLVLSQHATTGELAFKPVLGTSVRPEEMLVRIRAGKDVLEASGGHPLWVSGEGWTKARQLRPGVQLHGVHGATAVLDVEDGSRQETYNLVVADFHTYFVGQQKILCHDNTERLPTNAVVPGLSIH